MSLHVGRPGAIEASMASGDLRLDGGGGGAPFSEGDGCLMGGIEACGYSVLPKSVMVWPSRNISRYSSLQHKTTTPTF